MDIESLRDRLNSEIVTQNWELTHPVVVVISCLLDKLIVDEMMNNDC